MLGLAFHLSSGIRALLYHAPTNALLRRLRTRAGLKWSIPAMTIGVVYLLVAATATTIIDRGGAGWLHAVVLLAIWNGLKFLINGPIGLIVLVRARLAERRWTRAVIEEVRYVSETDGARRP